MLKEFGNVVLTEHSSVTIQELTQVDYKFTYGNCICIYSYAKFPAPLLAAARKTKEVIDECAGQGVFIPP